MVLRPLRWDLEVGSTAERSKWWRREEAVVVVAEDEAARCLGASSSSSLSFTFTSIFVGFHQSISLFAF